ncbi:MAG: type IV secretory system conjugative DNA transfer family protein, partial [Erysipelotrichaceae bacterium]|nr:type IV secretory system conjugative DNA transfer family protein [Erysipelotrichaceae bacterium]
NCTFDPLAYIKKDEDIIDLSESIVMAEERKEKSHADPFWDQSAISLLNAEIAYIKETMEHPTFADVLDFHFSLNLDSRGDQFYTDVDNKFYHLEKEKPTCFAVQQWKTFRDAAPKTAQSIYVSLNSTLMAFTETIRESMRTLPTVDFNQLEATNSILFITTSPVKRSLHTLGNIFVNRAITELHTLADEQPSGILKRPVHITFDDFATGAKVAGMPEKLSICREKGISFTLLVQSESQLSRMYGSYGAIEIMDNCDNYVFLGGNNYDTAKNISLKLNVPLEDILYMPIGQVIVFRRGQKPIITKRYDVLADPLYQSLKKNNTYIR